MEPPPPADYGEVAQKPPGPTPAAQHKEGEYGGVEPGQTATGQGVKKKKTPPKSTLNWIGFEAKDGAATVFFQAAGPFEVTQHVENGQLVAMLGLPHMGPNAWRQVDTRFFENPLSGVVARQVSARRATKTSSAHGAGIEVRFSFKMAGDVKDAAMRTATEADGQYYVYFAFPPGSGPASSGPASSGPATTGPATTPQK